MWCDYIDPLFKTLFEDKPFEGGGTVVLFRKKEKALYMQNRSLQIRLAQFERFLKFSSKLF